LLLADLSEIESVVSSAAVLNEGAHVHGEDGTRVGVRAVVVLGVADL
jgi:hypothetical protein